MEGAIRRAARKLLSLFRVKCVKGRDYREIDAVMQQSRTSSLLLTDRGIVKYSEIQ